MLYIVATPIGNLEDITLRALETLKSVDAIACEDTRHTGILLKHYDIKKPLLSFHSHSSAGKVDRIIEQLKEGKNIALVSDAGTPGISDPGYSLIHEAIEQGITVSPIPGASAVITALCASGLPTDKFTYLGFLPVKKGRRSLIQSLQDHPYTIVFYESPHRLLRTIKDLREHLKGDTKIVIGKELTKIHETYLRGTLDTIEKQLADIKVKGEYVIMMKGQ